MKILVLGPHPFFQERGTPIALRLLLESLAEQGHMLVALVFAEGKPINIENCSIIRTARVPLMGPVRPGFSVKKVLYDLLLFCKAWSLLRQSSFDVIHAGEEAVFLAWLLAKWFRKPYVYDMDSALPQQIVEKYPRLRWSAPILERIERDAIANSAGVLPVCRALATRIRGTGFSGPVQVLEDISLLEKQTIRSSPFQNDLPSAGVMTTIMYVGNLESYQGIDLLLESFATARKTVDTIRLVVIGGSDSDIRDYASIADEMGLSSDVLFLGSRPAEHLGHYLSQADVLVSPRIKGVNTPMKIYSYLDSGQPVLATRLPTHTQVLDKEIAMLADPECQSFAEALVTLASDPDLRKRLGKAAKKRVAEQYSIEAYKEKLANFYASLPITTNPKRA